MNLTTRQLQLLEFVKSQHGAQQRKYEGIPYWHHLYEVAKLVDQYIKTDGAIEIALCHDLLEDTSCTQSQLEQQLSLLGYEPVLITYISEGVVGMTDVFTAINHPDLNRKERKQKEARRLGGTAAIVHSVKYADMTDNVKSIVAGDPGFARVYMHEMIAILDQMRKGNIHLLINCCAALNMAQEELKAR